jgi:predicted RNA-binding protein with PUA-like domain
MRYWLLKTEPSTYSYADLERAGRAVWDGVANAVALKHLRAVEAGDGLLVYHTGDEKAVVGIARAVSGAYPDPQANDAKLVVIEIAPIRALPRPVPLAQVKGDPACAEFELVRLPRLSVMPVPATIWRRILTWADLEDFVLPKS